MTDEIREILRSYSPNEDVFQCSADKPKQDFDTSRPVPQDEADQRALERAAELGLMGLVLPATVLRARGSNVQSLRESPTQ